MKALLRYIPPKLRRRVKSKVLPPAFRALRHVSGSHPVPPSMTRFAVPQSEVFAGYYDIAPISPDGRSLLAHSTAVARRPPLPTEAIGIGYFDRASGKYTELARTVLWCWQLGARLRWWPGETHGMAFNGLIGDKPSHCLVTHGGRVERLADRPLFDVSANGSIGLALNFGRLARARPGYGYAAIEDPFAGDLLPSGDGITIVEIETGRHDLTVTMSDIVALSSADRSTSFHYLTAGSLSPTGKRFSLMHKRLARPDRVDVWDVRAVNGNIDGTGLHVVPLPGAPSHYWWLDDNRIAYTSNPRGTALHSGYYLYDVSARELSTFHPAAPKVDGHLSLDRTSGRWITDRYPDLYGEQTLFVLECDGSRKAIARLPIDPRYIGEWKCDLHPRWAPEGRSVVVDSTHEGYRAIYEVPVPVA